MIDLLKNRQVLLHHIYSKKTGATLNHEISPGKNEYLNHGGLILHEPVNKPNN
jgi:hypothetical protein